MWTPKKCPRCGADKMRERNHEEVIEVDGRTFKGNVSAAVCGACEEMFIPMGPLERLEQRVAAELVRVGASSGQAFKFMRKAVGLKAAELADLLGVSAETISRWENEAPDRGDTRRAPDRAAVAVLGAIVLEHMKDSTETLDRLRAIRSPAKPSGPVRLAV